MILIYHHHHQDHFNNSMISSVFPAAMTKYDDRLGRSRVKPLVVCKYNQSIGGVDKTDQYGCYYSFDRKSVKLWRKLMFWLLEVAIVNSYILYRETVGSPSSHADYRRQVVVSLCEGCTKTTHATLHG